ncbi:MAG: PKD domain-containing protein [Thermoplasmatota archaeon]
MRWVMGPWALNAKHGFLAIWLLVLLLFPPLSLNLNGASGARSTNYPPVAIISEPSSDVFLNQNESRSVAFSASGSYDPNGALAGWRWDFGDGATAEGMTALHEFPGPGLYKVVLTVYDHAGLEDRASRLVGIYLGLDPVAVISSPEDRAVVGVNWTVQFSSRGSYSPTRTALSCLWTFGDGSSSSDPDPLHRYSKPGAYAVSLRVTDSKGGSSLASISVVVARPEGVQVEWWGETSLEGERTYYRHSILLTGELRVRGNLVIVGSELVVDQGEEGGSGIVVERSGRIALLAGTRVHSDDPSSRFHFVVEPGGELLMEGSELRDCGGAWSGGGEAGGGLSRAGLYIASSRASILNSSIIGCGAGVIVDSGASPVISGCEISGCDGPAVAALNGSSPTIYGNTILSELPAPLMSDGDGAAIVSVDSSPAITCNTIIHSSGRIPARVAGVELRGGGAPLLARNRIEGFWGEVPCQGVLVSGALARIERNEIVACTVGIRVVSGRVETEGNAIRGKGLPVHSLVSIGILDSSTSRFHYDDISGCDIGVYLGPGSGSTMEGLDIHDNIFGVGGAPSRPAFATTMSSCIFESNVEDVCLGGDAGQGLGGSLWMVEPVYDPASVRVGAPGMSVTVTRLLKVRVASLADGAPVEGATVRVSDARGELSAELSTGQDGRARAVALPECVYTAAGRVARGPYNVSVAGPDGGGATALVELNESRELTLGVGDFSPALAILVEPSGEGGAPAGETHPVAGSPIALSASGAGALEGVDVSYFWDLGDGATAAGPSVIHTYNESGRYTIVLRASYGDRVRTVVGELRVKGRGETVVAQSLPSPLPAFAAALVILAALTAFIGWTEVGLYSASSLLMLLYSKLDSSRVLDNFIRGKIYGYIIANPGDHYNSIMTALRLSNGTFAYHLKVLEKQGLVKSQVDGVYKRFYPAEMVVPALDRRELTRIQRILFHMVVDRPGISQKELAAILKVSSATVNYHINALMRKELIRRERWGMRVRYYPIIFELVGKDVVSAMPTAPPP